MIINHNLMAMNTHRQLGINQTNSSKSMERLSSGMRINRAGDDAAGLAISEKMRGQIRGLKQASRNAQDGISLIQTAEGSLNETHSILQRMKELATQAANDTNTGIDRGEIQKEINALTTEINRIGNTTQFNTMNLLDGSVSVSDKYSAYAQGGAELDAVTNIITASTKANVVSTSLNASIEIHDASGAQVTAGAGAQALDDTGLSGTNLVFNETNNELTLKVNGVTKHVVLTNTAGSVGTFKTYDGTTADLTSADLLTNLNSDLSAAGVTASLDATTNKLVLTTNDLGADKSIEILGSGAALKLFGSNFETDNLQTAGKDSNRTMTFDIGSQADVSVTLDANTYTLSDLAAELQNKINAATTADDVTVTVEGSSLKIENNAAGSTHQIGDFKGNAASTLGLTSATITEAKDANHELQLEVDGETVNVTLSEGAYDRETLAGVLQTAINNASTTAKDVTVEVTSGNVMKITSGEEGTSGSIKNIVESAAADTLGLHVTNDSPTIDAGSDGKASDMKFQIGANNGQLMSINVDDMRSNALNIAGTAGTSQGVVAGAKFTAINGVSNGTETSETEAALDVSSVENATAAIEVLDNAIESVSAERSKLGAYQNRLDHTISNLGTSAENLQAAEARIRDLDMAEEIMAFTKNNILQQAATAMLAQANMAPQSVLQLLG